MLNKQFPRIKSELPFHGALFIQVSENEQAEESKSTVVNSRVAQRQSKKKLLTGVVRIVAFHVWLLLFLAGHERGGTEGLVQVVLIPFGVRGWALRLLASRGAPQGASAAEGRGSCGGETPWVTGEIVRYLLDGLNGTWTYINGHVLLDADGRLLAFALCHSCSPF